MTATRDVVRCRVDEALTNVRRVAAHLSGDDARELRRAADTIDALMEWTPNPRSDPDGPQQRQG